MMEIIGFGLFYPRGKNVGYPLNIEVGWTPPGQFTDTKKGKAVPLQAWSGPEGSRKLRFPDYITTA
jgi:hypothetical protein